jgi:hypothetical protein
MPKQFRSGSTGGQESREKEGLQVHVEDVKVEWSLLWRNRIDDKVRAEGIADKDFLLLFVDRGTVIVATKDFKPLNLKEILRLHQVQNGAGVDSPPPLVGGYGKFARDVLSKQKRVRRCQPTNPVERRTHKKMQPKKKGGRGWLNYQLKK